MNATFTKQNGEQEYYYMGCYGIGIGRTMATIVEKYHDDRGILWPESVAPFRVHLLQLGGEPSVAEEAKKLYAELCNAGVDVLFDDRDVRPGEKFADSDLIGAPYRVVVSQKSLASGGVELKRREAKDSQIIAANKLMLHIEKLENSH
jgi:prolyl-tRNA synthetase